MKNLFILPGIDPARLNSKERDELCDCLYEVHSEVFAGVSKEAFRRYVIEAPTVRSRIFPLRNRIGELVGYITHQQYAVQVNGRSQAVFRTEVGIREAYRGSNLASRLLLWEMIKAYIRNRFGRSWFVATPIHPTPYTIAARQLHEIYPHPTRPMSPQKRELLESISAALDLQEANTGLKYQKKVGWIVRESLEKRRSWQRSSNPFVQFYLRENPNYHEGTGMLMVVPVTVANGIAMLRNQLFRKLRKMKWGMGLIPRLPRQMAQKA